MLEWVKTRALFVNISGAIVKFLWEDVITRYGYINKLVIDGGLENKGFVDELFERYSMDRVVISAYNLKINGVIERGYKPITNNLVKL